MQNQQSQHHHLPTGVQQPVVSSTNGGQFVHHQQQQPVVPSSSFPALPHHHHHGHSSSIVDLTTAPVPPSGCPVEHPALPLHVQKLQRILDLNPFLSQLETLMSSSIKVPADSIPHHSSFPGAPNKPQNVFSVAGIWNSDEDQKKDVSAFYNFNTVTKKRKWLKTILLDESDSDSDGEQSISEQDLKALLKIHRCRRKYQKQYHSDILNSQYTYYGAGLLSDHDKFPDHQKFVQDQYGFMDFSADAPHTDVDVDAKIHEHVTDVVDSMFTNEVGATDLSRKSGDIVAAVVDSARQDGSCASGTKKKKAQPHKSAESKMSALSSAPPQERRPANPDAQKKSPGITAAKLNG